MAKDGGRRSKRGGRVRRAGGIRRTLIALLLCALLPVGLLGWMYAQAAIVRVCPAELYLPDLPSGFDGATILYVSDVNIRSGADATATAKLMDSLEALSPDLLLLGGDYSAGTLLDVINGTAGGDDAQAQEFLRALVNFRAPMGKFAVLGEADDGAALTDAFAFAGVQLLLDSGAWIERGRERIALVGLRGDGDESAPYGEIARSFRADECVLVLAHNPRDYTRIRMAEAQGGGAWADLVLSGHTLGGQIKLFGRTLHQFSDEEARRIAGWYYADDLPALVSQGLGCRGTKLRLGTRSEVWFITLRRPEWRRVES